MAVSVSITVLSFSFMLLHKSLVQGFDLAYTFDYSSYKTYLFINSREIRNAPIVNQSRNATLCDTIADKAAGTPASESVFYRTSETVAKIESVYAKYFGDKGWSLRSESVSEDAPGTQIFQSIYANTDTSIVLEIFDMPKSGRIVMLKATN